MIKLNEIKEKSYWKNTVFDEIQTRTEHGWNKEQKESDIEYNNAMNNIRNFDGKRVKIKYVMESDLSSEKGEKVGRIRLVDDQIKFFPGKKTTQFYYLDAGYFLGFRYVIIPMEIQEI